MKKFLAFLLSLTMVFAMAAVAFAEGETYLWDNFDDRDPNAKPDACAQRRAPLVGQLGEPARKE